MHSLAKKNPYIGFLFMKIHQEYFDLGRDKIHEISVKHASGVSERLRPSL